MALAMPVFGSEVLNSWKWLKQATGFRTPGILSVLDIHASK